MTATIIKFPPRVLPATRQPKPAVILVLPMLRIEKR